MVETSAGRFQLIGCEILLREVCHLVARSPRTIDVDFLPKGLHDLESGDMRAALQERIDALEPGRHEAVLLAYARCNDGLVGLRARAIPLVIPKAHDCITLFFGSREAFRGHFEAHPGTYYFTTGWCERADDEIREQPALGRRGVLAKLGLAASREELIERYGREEAEYLIETLGGWRKLYAAGLYLEMGVCDERPFLVEARRRAAAAGWRFEQRRGDLALLAKLIDGPWDEDLVIVQPGQGIAARDDGEVLCAE